jgi:hypothetical protein
MLIAIPQPLRLVGAYSLFCRFMVCHLSVCKGLQR